MRRAGWVLAATLVVAVPALAHAEGEGAAEPEGAGEHEAAPKLDLGKLGLQLLNFAVLAGILGWFGGKAIASREVKVV